MFTEEGVVSTPSFFIDGEGSLKITELGRGQGIKRSKISPWMPEIIPVQNLQKGIMDKISFKKLSFTKKTIAFSM